MLSGLCGRDGCWRRHPRNAGRGGPVVCRVRNPARCWRAEMADARWWRRVADPWRGGHGHRRGTAAGWPAAVPLLPAVTGCGGMVSGATVSWPRGTSGGAIGVSAPVCLAGT